MLERLSHHLFACGRESLPRILEAAGSQYRLARMLKRDFFAETGLYERAGTDGGEPHRVVLKAHRQQCLLGLPMGWLGWLTCGHERRMLAALEKLEQTPRLIARWGRQGFLYEYIEGQTLDEVKALEPEFFEELLGLVGRMHALGVVYLDMNKRSNILRGRDGRPYVIDFQISMLLSERGILGPVRGWLRRRLQEEDLYHVKKHRARFLPEIYGVHIRLACRPSLLIRLHRCVANPLRWLRRAVLRRLVRRGVLKADQGPVSAETDVTRYTK